MGSGASAVKNDDIPESMNLEEAKAWAKSFEVKDEDWPEEKWIELTGTDGIISRENIIKLYEELFIPSTTPKMEAMNISSCKEDDEEVFASDGNIDNPVNADLAQGTFNEDDEDENDLGGMMIPDLAVVGGSGLATQGPGALTQYTGEGEEIFAADGEAFETSSGPGCFDDDEFTGDACDNGLEVTGSPVKS